MTQFLNVNFNIERLLKVKNIVRICNIGYKTPKEHPSSEYWICNPQIDLANMRLVDSKKLVFNFEFPFQLAQY